MTATAPGPPISMHVVATAGHVDHGKSTLVRALTGTDPDRLAEERRRGLTIDLGFAWTELPAAGWVAFIDVPGHVDFIRNMIAGVAVIGAGLLVIDAREGWRAQTEEHLHILEMVGIERGLAVVTKANTVPVDDRELVLLDTRQRLPTWEVLSCDARDRTGLDDVRARLAAVLTGLPAPVDRDRPRLWVDRSFTIAGAGTVITGGLAHGMLRPGDTVQVVGRRGAFPARIRGVNTLGRARTALLPGSRAAVNLAGIDHRHVHRGYALVRDGEWHLTDTVDANLQVLASLSHDVTRRGAYLAYVGTGEHAARIRVLHTDRLAPGSVGHTRLRFSRLLPLVPGDRYVLRDAGRGETVGGGEILDVAPISRPSRAMPDGSVARVVAERGWIGAADLERLTGRRVPANVGRWVVSEHARATATAALLARIDAAGAAGLDVAALDKRERALLTQIEADGQIEVRAGHAVRADQVDDLANHPYLAALEAHPFRPPPPDHDVVSRNELEALIRRGLVVRLDGQCFAATAVNDAIETVSELVAAHPDGITVSQARNALNTTRRYAMPLLAHLDTIGVTRRIGDRRTAGPRLA